MIKFAFDGITSFSTKPLKMALNIGFVFSFFGFLLIILLIYLKLFTNHMLEGWTSVMVAIVFMGGIQLIMLGVIGEYVGRIYDEVRERPMYIIKDVIKKQ